MKWTFKQLYINGYFPACRFNLYRYWNTFMLFLYRVLQTKKKTVVVPEKTEKVIDPLNSGIKVGCYYFYKSPGLHMKGKFLVIQDNPKKGRYEITNDLKNKTNPFWVCYTSLKEKVDNPKIYIKTY